MMLLSTLTATESPAICSWGISWARAVSACLTSFQWLLFHKLVRPPVQQLCWTYRWQFHKWIQSNFQARNLWKEQRHGLMSKWETFTKELEGKKCLSCWNIWVIDTDSWAAKLWGPAASNFIYYGRCTRKERVKAAIFCGQGKQPHKSQTSLKFSDPNKASWCTQSHLVHHLGERAFKQEWTNQQVTLWIPQLSCGILHACKTFVSKPLTSLLFAHIPDYFTNLHMPKSWADQKFSLQTMGSACWTPPVIACSRPQKGNHLETPVRQRVFNITYIGCQLSLSTFKCPKH